MSQAPGCPVCRGTGCGPFQAVDERSYWRCPDCACTFLDPAQRPGPARERAEYALHRNTLDDPGYRRFLARLADPLLERLPPRREGLDFGCGPAPALAAMLQAAGHRMHLYDPAFHDDPAALQRRYDFITCTEVVEHLHDPAGTFDRLHALLRPGGLLAVMTCFQTDDARFAGWHYRRDPTHVVFYREATLCHVAARLGMAVEVVGKDVVVMVRREKGEGEWEKGGHGCGEAGSARPG